MKLREIDDAFLFVGGAAFGERTAMIDRQTGPICYRSEMSDMDEDPEEAHESDSWLEVLHKNELDLGWDLVFSFVAQREARGR